MPDLENFMTMQSDSGEHTLDFDSSGNLYVNGKKVRTDIGLTRFQLFLAILTAFGAAASGIAAVVKLYLDICGG